jgi:hypothetical protein
MIVELVLRHGYSCGCRWMKAAMCSARHQRQFVLSGHGAYEEIELRQDASRGAWPAKRFGDISGLHKTATS